MPRTGYRKPILDRILPRTNVTPAGCFEWQGRINKDGYGQINDYLDGRRIGTSVHRAAYRHLVGELSPDLTLDHLCRNTACWNPDHLEPVSGWENTRRSAGTLTGANARKSECIHGHAFTPENTFVRPSGHRVCRTCRQAAQRRHASKRRIEVTP